MIMQMLQVNTWLCVNATMMIIIYRTMIYVENKNEVPLCYLLHGRTSISYEHYQLSSTNSCITCRPCQNPCLQKVLASFITSPLINNTLKHFYTLIYERSLQMRRISRRSFGIIVTRFTWKAQSTKYLCFCCLCKRFSSESLALAIAFLSFIAANLF